MKDEGVWKFILEQLRGCRPVMLVTVMDYEKGSPGKTGFKMAVTETEMTGTIGGSIMEFNLLVTSRTSLGNNETVRMMKKLIHNPNTLLGEPSGLICAGSQTVSLISLDHSDIETVNSILSALEWGAPAHIILSNSGLSFRMERNPDHFTFNMQESGGWTYSENIGSEYTAFVIGGGHVGSAVARVLQTLDFNVVLIDDRENAPAMRDPALRIRKIVSAFDAVGPLIGESDKHFVAIVTAAIQTDKMALECIVRKQLGYVGVMGTKAKLSRILNSFSKNERLLLESIHAPIGIDIRSRTVEEIAISVAAEMIKVKNAVRN